LHGEPHVFEDRRARKDIGALERAADAEVATRGPIELGDVAVSEDHAAFGRRGLAAEQVEQRRLAGAVRSDDRVQRSCAHGDIDAVDGRMRAELLAQAACRQITHARPASSSA
jgi:hypothetical protein